MLFTCHTYSDGDWLRLENHTDKNTCGTIPLLFWCRLHHHQDVLQIRGAHRPWPCIKDVDNKATHVIPCMLKTTRTLSCLHLLCLFMIDESPRQSGISPVLLSWLKPIHELEDAYRPPISFPSIIHSKAPGAIKTHNFGKVVSIPNYWHTSRKKKWLNPQN